MKNDTLYALNATKKPPKTPYALVVFRSAVRALEERPIIHSVTILASQSFAYVKTAMRTYWCLHGD